MSKRIRTRRPFSSVLSDNKRLLRLIRSQIPLVTEMATVTANVYGSPEMTVRLSGGKSQQVLKSSLAADMMPGEQCLMIRTPTHNRWTALCPVDTAAGGTVKPNPYQGDVFTSPVNFTVVGGGGYIAATWDSRPEVDLFFEVRTDDAGSGDGTEAMLTRGSMFYLELAVGSTKYVRVRAMRWINDNDIMFSGWTDWTAGTSLALGGSQDALHWISW